MNLSAALFISDDIQARDVKLPDGSVHALHFRQLPAAEFRRFFTALQSDDEAVMSNAMAKLITASLCTPDGKPALQLKDALRLKPLAEKAIGDAVLDVNGLGSKPGKA